MLSRLCFVCLLCAKTKSHANTNDADVGDASGDDYSVKSFDDHLADLEEDLDTGKYAAASVNDQDGISFAHDDDADFPYVSVLRSNWRHSFF